MASTFTVPRCTMEVSCVAESGGSLALFARIFSSFQDRAQCVLQELGHVGPLMSLLCCSLCLMLLRSLALSMCDETQDDNGDGFGTKIWSHDLPWLQNTNFCASTLVARHLSCA